MCWFWWIMQQHTVLYFLINKITYILKMSMFLRIILEVWSIYIKLFSFWSISLIKKMYYLHLQIHHATLAPRRKLGLLMTRSLYTAKKPSINDAQQVIYSIKNKTNISRKDVVPAMTPSGQYILCSGNMKLWNLTRKETQIMRYAWAKQQTHKFSVWLVSTEIDLRFPESIWHSVLPCSIVLIYQLPFLFLFFF